MKIRSLFPLFAALLFASCAQVEYRTGVVVQYPVLMSDLLRFLAFALLNLLLLVQCFIPRIRRLYAACFRTSQPMAAALAARLLFLFGLSLLPMTFALAGEAFYPSPKDSYDPFGSLFMAFLVPLVAMPLGAVVLGLGTLLHARSRSSLRRIEPQPTGGAWQTRFALLAVFACILLAQCYLVIGFRRPPLDRICRIAMSDHAFNERTGVIGAEAHALGHRYREERNARAVSPTHRITPLHLAAAAQEPELVRQLLDEGADPNARMLSRPAEGCGLAPGDTPLTLALRREASFETQRDIEGAAAVVDALLRAGADISLTGHAGSTPLALCAESYRFERGFDYATGDPTLSGEDFALCLLAAGARGGQAEAELMLHNGWGRALGKMLELGLVERPAALLRLCGSTFCNMSRQVHDMAAARACAAALVEHVPATVKNELLAQLCCFEFDMWQRRRDEAGRAEGAAFIALLLNHGADPYASGGAHRCSCAADYLAADADMRSRLDGKAAIPAPPAHKLEAGRLVMQLLDIPTQAFSEEEARAHVGLAASLLSWPTPAQLGAPEAYYQACARALALMLRGDDAAARELAPTLPFRGAENWGAAPIHARGLLYAMQRCQVPLLDADKLVEDARALLAAGHPEAAHALVRLLEYDPQADALIESLCAEGTPDALRAAAWTCKLHRAKLPALGMDEVRHCINSLPGDPFDNKQQPALKLALEAELSAFWADAGYALRQPERLFFSGEGQACYELHDRQREALRQLGAYKALALYHGESQDEVAASLELEILLGQHIWRHRDSFYGSPAGEAAE